MAIIKFKNNQWDNLFIEPYRALEIYPGATILNYGQGIFEGIKAYKTIKNKIVLFRPNMNYDRFIDGCNRLLIPILPKEIFFDMLNKMINSNINLIPDIEKGDFYIRPIIFGSGQSLMLQPSNEYIFAIYGSPIGNYFSKYARLLVENKYIRALNISNKIGMGNIKYNGNYAQCFLPLNEAKKLGYSDILYLNIDNTISETCSSNFFIIDKNKILRTPELGSILPGITRETIIDLSEKFITDLTINGIEIGPINFIDILEANEAFLTGTGVCITPIEYINTPIGDINYKYNNDTISYKIKNIYKNIINETIENNYNWLYYIK